MVLGTGKSLSARIALWIMIGMLGGLATGIIHGFFYPERKKTTILLIVVCAIGVVLAGARYLLQRRKEKLFHVEEGVRDDQDHYPDGTGV